MDYNQNSNALALIQEPENKSGSLQANETAGQVLSSQVKALVESRFIVAKKCPRDIDIVRQKLLKECKRPYFAEVAIYTKPVSSSKSVSGPSIRFAESAIRCMGNITIDTYAIYDDSKSRIVRVSASDIESNTSYSIDVTIQKTVERKFAKQGDAIISKRYNSKNELVYILAATDDELTTKQNALISKAVRTIGLRLIPGDLIDECLDEIKITQNNKDKADPDSAKRKIIDSFDTIGISVDELKKYIGRDDLKTLSNAEISDLRGIYLSLKDGEMSWRDVMETVSNVPKTKSDKELLTPKEPEKPEQNTKVETPPEKQSEPTEPDIDTLDWQEKIEFIKSKIGNENLLGFVNYLIETKRLPKNAPLEKLDWKFITIILKDMDKFKAKAIEYQLKENVLL